MKGLAPRLALVVCLLASAAPVRAQSDEKPFETIRNLQQLQDQIAEGDTLAQAAYAKAIEHTARLFATEPSASWNDTRNARALVTYLFSGGRAAIIADAIPDSVVAADYRSLYVGALAYGLGDDEQARTALMAIDPKSLPTSIGGHLALVQATLCAETDRNKAMQLLDLARLLEPGTLIEEAALRKEMSLIGAGGDLEKFGLLARRYLGIYSRSIYAENFRQLVATTALELGASDTPEAAGALSRLVANLDKTQRRRLLLVVAREAVIAGRLRMAMLAAEEARQLSPEASQEAARAMVYLGAATIVGERYETGRKALADVPDDRLPLKDRALRRSAIVVADTIRRPSPQAATASGTSPDAAVLAEGTRAIAAADDLLNRVEK